MLCHSWFFAVYIFSFLIPQVAKNGFVRFGDYGPVEDLASPTCFEFMSKSNFPYDGLFSLFAVQQTTGDNDDLLIYVE